MNSSKKTPWISVAILLVGCNSFNRYELKELPVVPTSVHVQKLATHEDDATRQETMSKLTCPAFVMPKFPAQPELPYSKLKNLRSGDNEAIDLVYANHIAELRKHNRVVNKIFTDAYAKYLEQCKHK